MAIISQADIQARLGRSLSTEEDYAFDIVYDALKNYIESIIGSSIDLVDPETRYYDGGVHFLSIDPCTDITAVTYTDADYNIDSTFEDNEYSAEPKNRTLKTMIRPRYGRFTRGMNNVAVTATFSIAGDERMLAVVKDAMLTGLEVEIANTNNITRESIEGYTVEFAEPQTKSALDRLRTFFPEV